MRKKHDNQPAGKSPVQTGSGDSRTGGHGSACRSVLSQTVLHDFFIMIYAALKLLFSCCLKQEELAIQKIKQSMNIASCSIFVMNIVKNKKFK